MRSVPRRAGRARPGALVLAVAWWRALLPQLCRLDALMFHGPFRPEKVAAQTFDAVLAAPRWLAPDARARKVRRRGPRSDGVPRHRGPIHRWDLGHCALPDCI